MNKEEAWLFVRQYTTGYYTKTDHEQFLNWLVAQPPVEQESLLNEFSDYLEEALRRPVVPLQEEGREELFEKIRQQITDQQTDDVPAIHEKIKSSPSRWIWRIAATLIVVASVAWAYYQFILSRPMKEKVTATEPIQEILPGGDKAVLTLSDGRRIILDTATNGEIAQQQGTQLIKGSDQLTYNTISETTGSPVYNTVSTPRGGQYRIVLPDGSRVWLNAASFIRFPTAFSDKDRHVELQGEAYFEIVDNKDKPFQVAVKSTSGMDSLRIQVLGTRFNVNSYGDEAMITTTLLDGAVAVNHADDSKMLRAGQQARAFVTGKMQVDHHADTSSVTAWQRGLFQFTDSPIGSVMRQLARWYDLDVRYEGKVKEHFNATIPRQLPLTKVLSLLEQTNAVTFTIQNKQIIVKP